MLPNPDVLTVSIAFAHLHILERRRGCWKERVLKRRVLRGMVKGEFLGSSMVVHCFTCTPIPLVNYKLIPTELVGTLPVGKWLAIWTVRLRSVRQYKTDFWQYITCNSLFTLNIEMNGVWRCSVPFCKNTVQLCNMDLTIPCILVELVWEQKVINDTWGK